MESPLAQTQGTDTQFEANDFSETIPTEDSGEERVLFSRTTCKCAHLPIQAGALSYRY